VAEMQDRDEDIGLVVDEIVDDMDPARLEREAGRLNIPVEQLLDRVLVEARYRVEHAR